MSAKHRQRADNRPITRRYLERQMTRLYNDLARLIVTAQATVTSAEPAVIHVVREQEERETG